MSGDCANYAAINPDISGVVSRTNLPSCFGSSNTTEGCSHQFLSSDLYPWQVLCSNNVPV
jgi:hypothetical protein